MYSRLPEDQKDNIKKLVYILDWFHVSVQAYHKLAQLHVDGNSAIAWSYLVDLTASVEISKTPGQSPDAEMHFPDLLEEQCNITLQLNNYFIIYTRTVPFV